MLCVRMSTTTRWIGSVAILLALAAGELSARPRTFVAGQGVRMVAEVPAGYSFKSETNQNGVTLVVMENPVWRIVITVLLSSEYPPEASTDEWQRNLVVSHSADFLAQSKEQDYQFRPLMPVSGSGVYCIFTDPAVKPVEELKPDEYNHVLVGAKVVRGAAMYFRILCNDVTSPEFKEALGVFINAFDPA